MSLITVEEHEYITHVLYASAVGSLMYWMVYTRPDLSQTISIVSRYIHDPDRDHWEAVKWILWYIKGTIDISLAFKKDVASKQECIWYVDSDYAGDLDKCQSTTGYVFTLSQSPVSWGSTLQSTIALSTIEAEYMSMTEAMKEAIWLQELLNDLGIDQDMMKINCDSMSDIYLVKNQVYHARTKYIDVGFHFFWEILDEDDIKLQLTWRRNPLICLSKLFWEWSLNIAKNYSISFQLCKLSGAHLDKLHMAWSRWAWVHRQPQWCNQLESTRCLLCSAQIWEIFTEVENCVERG